MREGAGDNTLKVTAYQTDKLRIAWLIAGDEEGGVAQTVRGLVGAVKPLGVAPAVVSLCEGPFLSEMKSVANEVESLEVPKPPSLSGNLLNKSRLQLQVLRTNKMIRPRLAAALRRFEVEVVHVVWPNLMPVAARAARDAGTACLWEMPNILGKYPFGINRRLIHHTLSRWSVSVLANSHYTAATLGERPVRPTVLYPGGDESRFSPYRSDLISRAALGIPDDAVVLGIFARLTPEKGQRQILEAVGRLPNKYSTTHLLCVGGPLEQDFAGQLRLRAGELRMSDRLHLVGAVPDPERYYGAVDIAVNARIDAEPFGLSVVEAMLMGKPTLVHALGGPAETVVDGETGWHVENPTEEGFRAGLLRALGERDRWREMGIAGRRRSRKDFGLSRQAEVYLEVVRGILEHSRHAHDR